MTAAEIIRAGERLPARPWPRYGLSSAAWRDMAHALPAQPALQFQALWAGSAHIYALFTDPEPLLVSAPIEAGLYAALSPARPEASLFERAAADLWGHQAADALDVRPWLDHGAWPVLHPMLSRPPPNPGLPPPPEPPPAAAIAQGPVRPGLAEPARLTLHVQAGTVAAIEPRLGYAHKGTLALMRGRTPGAAAPLASRLSAEGAIAHAIAFATAAEAALGAEPPPRAQALRAIAAGLERAAIHLHDQAAMLDAAARESGPALLLRDALLDATAQAFSHRIPMDFVQPGGVAYDILPNGVAFIGEATRHVLATAPVSWPRTAAIQAACRSLESLLAGLPAGPLAAALPGATGEGLGRSQGTRGTYWHWLRIQDGRVAEAFARDPAWMLWQQFQSSASGTDLLGLAQNAAALGLSVSGMDL